LKLITRDFEEGGRIVCGVVNGHRGVRLEMRHEPEGIRRVSVMKSE
jgi:hypothetical protein